MHVQTVLDTVRASEKHGDQGFACVAPLRFLWSVVVLVSMVAFLHLVIGDDAAPAGGRKHHHTLPLLRFVRIPQLLLL